MNKLIISIIIPVYNRASLVGETLDAILAQTYTHWECILVDDHSTDHTTAILENYRLKDKRIQWHRRPKNRPKGANACRNCGFEYSVGDYVLFYDSDDIMLPDKLEKSITAIAQHDFVISRSLNFKGQEFFDIPNYPSVGYRFNLPDFFAARVFWITDDALIRKEAIKTIQFDESLHSGQEYNFFCKMLLCTHNGVSQTEVTSHRRLHQNSIQSAQSKKELTLHTNRYQTYRKTFLLCHTQLGKPEKRFLVRRSTKHVLGLRRLGNKPPELKKLLNLLKDGINPYEFFILVFGYQFVKYTNKGDTFFATYIEKCMTPSKNRMK